MLLQPTLVPITEYIFELIGLDKTIFPFSSLLPFQVDKVEEEEKADEPFEGEIPEEEEEMEGFEDEKKKVEGFESLHPAPYQQSELLDKFSQVPGKLDCQGYGYHNSRGPLCLTDDLVKSLKTRGGNATGKPDSLGK